MTDLLDRTLAGGCFDAKRISITGVSNGAGFAARLACALPDRFAAVVPVAAGYRALEPCPGSARASFLDIHGSADTVTPYDGKRPDRAGSVPRYTAALGAPRRLRREPDAEQPAPARHPRALRRLRPPGCASSACACRGPTTAGRAPGRRSRTGTRPGSAQRVSCCASSPPRGDRDERRRAKRTARPAVRDR